MAKLSDSGKAFAMASNASENERYDPETRDLLARIASLIWRSLRKEAGAKLMTKPKTVRQMRKRIAEAHAVYEAYSRLVSEDKASSIDSVGINNMMLIGAWVGIAWVLGEKGGDSLDRALGGLAARIAAAHGPACPCGACETHHEISRRGV